MPSISASENAPWPQGRGFPRELASLRGGEGDQAVLGLGEVVDEARYIHACRTEAARRDGPIGVAGVEE
jgi:hypothetical protein